MRDKLPIEVAVLVSLGLHVLALFGAEHRQALAKRFPVLQRLTAKPPVPVQVAKLNPPLPAPVPATPTITFVERIEPEPPKTFVETVNSQVTGEKPVTSEFYSDRATVAANPSNPTGKTGDTPFLDGTGRHVPSTTDVLPGRAAPPVAAPPPPIPVTPTPVVKPATPPAPPPPAEKPEVIADAGLKVVEEPKRVEVASLPKPTPTPLRMPQPSLPVVPPPVPGTGNEREIAAPKSKMASAGTAKIGVAAFNVAESPFGAYDKAIVRAVQSRWYALIEKNGLYERAGQVTLKFQLLDDGTVQAMEVKENTAGQILALFCEKAVVESAPFAPLPGDLRVLIGKEPRDVSFTFYY